MMIPIVIVIVLYVLLLAGLGGRLWSEHGRVSAAQEYVIVRSTLRLAAMATALVALLGALLVVLAP
jgi:hypothetical protein